MIVDSLQFSVLMSVYSKENPEWFKKAVDSIISSTIVPNQIVVVKDGPLTEELEKVLDDYLSKLNFTVVGYDENKGLGYALDYGLSFCKYEYIARMDSDDICVPNRFEKQLLFLKNNPTVDVVGSNVGEFVENENSVVAYKIVPEKQDKIAKYVKKRNPFNHPTVVFKKSVIQSVGGYESLFRLEDYYLWYRVIKNGYIGYNLQENLVLMRTTKDFYKRRGGFSLYKSRMKLNRIMLKDKYIGIMGYLRVWLVSFANAIMPNFIRKTIFKFALRKTANKQKGRI